jgi:hypothetical protein
VYRALPFAAKPAEAEIMANEMDRGWSVSDRLDSAPVLGFAGNVLFRK